jgi:two-component system, cell cycle sensor histidine kinase and response regulator CckA
MRALQNVLRALTPAEPPAPESLRILVVDDEPTVLEYLNRILTRSGYRPALASNPGQAVQVAATMDRVDLLVTDLAMPEMNGEELAAAVRSRYPSVKVLYQTGHSDRLFEERSALGGVDAFIEKPYSVGGLQEAVSLLAFGVTQLTPPRLMPAVWTA